MYGRCYVTCDVTLLRCYVFELDVETCRRGFVGCAVRFDGGTQHAPGSADRLASHDGLPGWGNTPGTCPVRDASRFLGQERKKPCSYNLECGC